ncbi:MAG TPA: glutathione S-transferase family protein [Stellaceae bacterium]|nr:glutathione S-transferase family protein [Stellaceae bacterium]
MLELYNAPQSTCSQKVRLTLAEKGLHFVEYKLKLFQNDQLKPEYLKLNPNGVVPTLVDDGAAIIDSSVIMEYLEEEYPATRLSPPNSKERARMRAWLRYFEEVPTVAVRFPSYNAAFARHFAPMTDDEFRQLARSKPLRDKFLGEMDKEKGFSGEKLRQAEDSIGKTAARMEAALAQTDYLMGAQVSLADFCVLPLLVRMEDLGYEFLWSEQAGVKAWLARMKARPSFAAAYYPGSLLSEQYPGIREEHQRKRAVALGEAV